MLDPRFIREHHQEVIDAAKAKNIALDFKRLFKLDEEKRKTQARAEETRALQRELSSAIPKAAPAVKKKLIADSTKLKEQFVKFDKKLKGIEAELIPLLLAVPNIPLPDVPVGKDESGNQVLRVSGSPTKFDFKPRPHWEIGEGLGVIDNERAAKVSGARFTYLRGKLALLQFALIQFVMRTVTDRAVLETVIHDAKLDVPSTPFIPVVPPVMLKPDTFARMARLDPREERYYLPTDDLYLAGSAEHTIGSMHMDEILEERSLPLRYIGYATSFRREAGSYGKDTRGILRLHQFDKLEFESFTVGERSSAEQDLLVALQERLMRSLGLPYRIVAICTGDMGAPDARQIDLETWMPGQGAYRETHTADLMTDFQARRLQTRIRRAAGTVELAHMNDATALAIGRTLVAIIENYQEEDGSVRVPEVLIPHCGFDRITRE